jgi:hypothetical protein
MTGKADFTDEEWEQIIEAPASAGMLVVLADRGGTFRETFSMAKAYSDARQQHGASELLDAVVSTRPKVDRHAGHSPEELKERLLGRVREAVATIERKATPEELEDYRRFVLGLAERVAAAHREHGVEVSERERAAIADVAGALGVPAT